MKEIRFAVFNDLHAVDKVCGDWLAGIVGDLKKSKDKPAFIILDGDLSEHGLPAQLTSVRDVFKTLGVPVHVVIGNHDWKTNTDRKAYDETYPKSSNYTFDHEGWQFVFFFWMLSWWAATPFAFFHGGRRHKTD